MRSIIVAWSKAEAEAGLHSHHRHQCHGLDRYKGSRVGVLPDHMVSQHGKETQGGKDYVALVVVAYMCRLSIRETCGSVLR